MEENRIKVVLEQVNEILEDIRISDDNYRSEYHARYSRHHFTTPEKSVRQDLNSKLGELIQQLPEDIRENQEFRFELMQLVAPVAIDRGDADVVDIIEYCPAAISADHSDLEILKGDSILDYLLEYDTYNLERVIEKVPEVIKYMPQNTEISKILFEVVRANRELLELDSVKHYISNDPDISEKINEILERENKEKILNGLMEKKSNIEGEIEQLKGETLENRE